ncbi:Hsp33 protein [gut metagenome]|uniref:Hsp33 protein n=1 Tax=gut metagenome TaxID=749906 RepID=J9GZH0_9ZZZZ
MAACALLTASALQFDGSVLLQIAGDGPVKLIVVEVPKDLTFRISVTLRTDAEAIDPNASFTDLVNVSGNGRCALILDQADRAPDAQPYQGVVALNGESFAQAMTNYFISSEQVETKLMLASDDCAVGGIMVQKMPVVGGKALPDDFDEDGWQRIQTFVDTIKSEELLTLTPEDINRRLFWEESPLVTFEAEPRFQCRCSEEGVRTMVRNLGREEAESIIAEQGAIDVTCHFCGRHFHFEKSDLDQLFSENRTLN